MLIGNECVVGTICMEFTCHPILCMGLIIVSLTSPYHCEFDITLSLWI